MKKTVSRIIISVEIFVATLLILCIAAQLMMNNDLEKEAAVLQVEETDFQQTEEKAVQQIEDTE